MDENRLTFWQRVQVRLHLFMCSLCGRFRKQAEFLRQAARKFVATTEDATGPALPAEAKERIKKAIKSAS